MWRHHSPTYIGNETASSFLIQYTFYAAVQIQTIIKTESASFDWTNVWTIGHTRWFFEVVSVVKNYPCNKLPSTWVPVAALLAIVEEAWLEFVQKLSVKQSCFRYVLWWQFMWWTIPYTWHDMCNSNVIVDTGTCINDTTSDRRRTECCPVSRFVFYIGFILKC